MATELSDPRTLVRAIVLVAGIALCAGLLITGAWELSHERILENERARLLASLASVIDPAVDDPIAVELDLPGTGDNMQIAQVYAMLEASSLIAWVYVAVAPQGYNGPIDLLVGIRPDQTVSSVRVLRHRETPGLGDAIETQKSDWIAQFANRSLGDPANWALEVDGGSFDAITGATVTPRAVVAAIEAVLQYHDTHEDALETAMSRGNVPDQ